MKNIMKAMISFILTAGLLTACGNQADNIEIPQEVTTTTTAAERVTDSTGAEEDTSETVSVADNNETEDVPGKTLIAYFTVAENGELDVISSATLSSYHGEDMGSAEVIANMIADNTGAELFSIQTDVDYPTVYDDLADYAKAEQDSGTLPALTTHIDDISQYDTIFLVYPVWWYTMPQAIYSFIDEYDLSDKTIIPVTTHEGSGLADSVSKLQELEPNANVVSNGYSVRASDAADAENDVKEWLNEVGF